MTVLGEKDWATEYWEVWNRFGEQLSAVLRKAARTDSGGASMHELLRSCYDAPYQNLMKIGACDPEIAVSKRSGSSGGVFFEGLVAAVILGTLRSRCGSSSATRNGYLGDCPADLPKEPDIYAEHCGRKIVIEVKAQVHSPTIDFVRNLHERYRQFNYEYFLVAGWASTSKSTTEWCADNAPWITMLTGGNAQSAGLARMARVDDILESICRCDRS